MGKRVNLIRLMAHDEYISYRQFVTIQSRISYFLRGKLLRLRRRWLDFIKAFIVTQVSQEHWWSR